MARISSITIDNAESTFKSNLLSIESVDSFAKELVTEVGVAIDDWISTLEEEMSDGGLSSQALVIGGDPILYSYTGSFVRYLEQRKTMLENARTKLLNQARQHRHNELVKLEEVLVENKKYHKNRIKALYKEMSTLGAKDSDWVQNVDAPFGSTYWDNINGCSKKIEWADELLSQIRADECYNFSGGE